MDNSFKCSEDQEYYQQEIIKYDEKLVQKYSIALKKFQNICVKMI